MRRHLDIYDDKLNESVNEEWEIEQEIKNETDDERIGELYEQLREVRRTQGRCRRGRERPAGPTSMAPWCGLHVASGERADRVHPAPTRALVSGHDGDLPGGDQ